jgi:hypothetical protein
LPQIPRGVLANVIPVLMMLTGSMVMVGFTQCMMLIVLIIGMLPAGLMMMIVFLVVMMLNVLMTFMMLIFYLLVLDIGQFLNAFHAPV